MTAARRATPAGPDRPDGPPLPLAGLRSVAPPCPRPGRSATGLEHEVVAGLEPRLGRRAAVRRRPRLALLEPDDELLLGAEDDVAVQVLRALLEQVGDQRLVAGHVDQEVDVRRPEVADLRLRDRGRRPGRPSGSCSPSARSVRTQ